MEFSAVNRRRPSRETPLGRERRRMAVFAGYPKGYGLHNVSKAIDFGRFGHKMGIVFTF